MREADGAGGWPAEGGDIGQGERADTAPTVPLAVGAPLPAPITPNGLHGDISAKGPKRLLNRRNVLIGAGAGTLAVGMAGAGIGYVLSQRVTDPGGYGSDAMRLAHLLRRAGFGPGVRDGDAYSKLGISGTIERLLSPGTTDDGLAGHINESQYDFTKPADLSRWFLTRMTLSKRPLEEKMTLFWHGMLTSSYQKLGKNVNFPLLKQQNDLLRTHALGRYDDLVRAITTDPAMLWWLDGRLSTGKSPNENYARELMELFTMGIGHYTQDDVHQGALALAGWGIRDGKGVLDPKRRYDGDVTFLGSHGRLGVDDVVRLVCAHPATGMYLARHLWAFFVNDNPADGDIAPVAKAYYDSGHTIAAMLKVLFTSPRFYSRDAYRARIKSPVEFVVGTLRALGFEQVPPAVPGVLTQMGQTLFAPPDVSGWPGDKASAAWLSTQTWMTRVNFANTLVAALAGSAATARTGTAGTPAVQQLVSGWQVTTPDALVARCVDALLGGDLPADRVQVLRAALDTGGGGATLPLGSSATVPLAGVRQMLYLLLAIPEFQLN